MSTHSYTFTQVTASNGVKLNAIKTSPNSIYIRYIGASSVPAQSEYGVNGGFFSDSTLLNIAVNNDVPINGGKNDYGSGYQNVSYARGTLVWDAAEGEFSVQVVSSATSLAVLKRNAYWAQGGISMSLRSDRTWKSQAQKEKMPSIDSNANRTALVYNNTKNIWLIVTNTRCTAEEFRTAIKEKIGSGTLVDGIFLDGGGSSQYKVSEGSYNGSDSTPRKVYQMVAIR